MTHAVVSPACSTIKMAVIVEALDPTQHVALYCCQQSDVRQMRGDARFPQISYLATLAARFSAPCHCKYNDCLYALARRSMVQHTLTYLPTYVHTYMR